MKFIGIIPARYASTRFPAKPLADLCGKPVIRHVYEKVSAVLDEVYVATDDKRIYDIVQSFGGKVIMTSENHQSGTDRCFEAYLNSGSDADVIVNIQGDEPFISSSQLETIKGCFNDEETEIATLIKPFVKEDGIEALKNPNSPKVVVDNSDNALYFSRSVIPFVRNYPEDEWFERQTFYKHIGLYAYKKNILKAITSLPQSTLEKAESLEQLRWLQNGFTIKTGITNTETIGIDTPEDLEKAIEFYIKNTK